MSYSAPRDARNRFTGLPAWNARQPVDAVDWDDPEQVELLKELVSEDSPEGLSAWARHVCGFNYFKVYGRDGNQHTVRAFPRRWYQGVVWTCGIVDYGPHRDMLLAYLSPTHAVIVCSRDSFKTHCAIAWISRFIALNRDITIIIFMQTASEAEKTVLSIRQVLESDEAVKLFGPFKGKQAATWGKDRFTVEGRSNKAARDPTVFAVSVEKFSTGAHCDIFYADDPVGFQTARSPEQIEKAINSHQALLPLANPGFKQRITVTPYEPDDYCDWVMGLGLPTTLIPCGMTAEYDPQHQPILVGNPSFPHLTQKHLSEVLGGGMSVERFNRQYALRFDDTGTFFRREDFIVGEWSERMAGLNAYLLTDTASSRRDTACMSVLAWVILDWDGTAYVADLSIGRWLPSDMVEELFRMIERWQHRTPCRGVTMERTQANDVYGDWLKQQAKQRGVNLRLIPIARGGSLGSENQPVHKHQRIAGLQQYFRSRRIIFLPSIPRTFIDQGRVKLLFDPQGYRVAGGTSLPDGELVTQFTRWKDSPKYRGTQDIADCLADLHALDSRGDRLLALPPRPRPSGSGGPGGDRRAPMTPRRAHTQSLRSDYWSRFRTR